MATMLFVRSSSSGEHAQRIPHVPPADGHVLTTYRLVEARLLVHDGARRDGVFFAFARRRFDVPIAEAVAHLVCNEILSVIVSLGRGHPRGVPVGPVDADATVGIPDRGNG